ncbi:hypothetical protein FRC00_003378 [Tulasnella sp. 408]|nr:hypothetical protein FRC00_003378 [Tulasnella sp. 408]
MQQRQMWSELIAGRMAANGRVSQGILLNEVMFELQCDEQGILAPIGDQMPQEHSAQSERYQPMWYTTVIKVGF